MRRLVLVALPALAIACRSNRSATSATPAPVAEFLVSTEDSTFWVTSGSSGTHARGVPMQLARFDGRFYEVYSMDDDRSYEDALLVGQRLYRRDLESGDSVMVFADTTVPRVARAYAQANPDQQPLGPDDDTNDDPRTVATADIDILDVHGPYLSFEYHVDLQLPPPSGQSWHSTRRGVVDLRSARPTTLRSIFGDSVARSISTKGQAAYREISDSLRSEAGGGRRGSRVTRSLASFRFDETSFTLTSLEGRPAVAFVAPGRARSPEVVPLPLPPIPAAGARWWSDVRPTLPMDDSGNVSRWRRNGYGVVARTDSSGGSTQISIVDPAGHSFPVVTTSTPARHIFWLDAPPVVPSQRKALVAAFEGASQYDENVRTATRYDQPTLKNSFGIPARNVGAHDAAGREQPGPRVRRRRDGDDGQVRRHLRAAPRAAHGRHGIDRSRGLS